MTAQRTVKHTVARRAPHLVQIVRPWRGLWHPPIVVYSMGKVGSTSLQVTLGSLRLPNPVFHVHFLSWDRLRAADTCRWGFGPGPLEHLEDSKHLQIFADHTWGRVRWRVITLVRDPVARLVSDLFQNSLDIPQLRGRGGEDLADAAVEVLRDRLEAFDETTDYVCTWFDRELKAVFDFDVFDAPFDPATGFAAYAAPNADILLIRLEDLSRRGPEALEAFLGAGEVRILNANQAVGRTTRDAYGALLDKLALPDSTLSSVYGSRFARHFYSPDELEGFKTRWCGT